MGSQQMLSARAHPPARTGRGEEKRFADPCNPSTNSCINSLHDRYFRKILRGGKIKRDKHERCEDVKGNTIDLRI